jgi:hypothetical protein
MSFFALINCRRCQCLCIVFVLCLVFPILPVSLYCFCPVSCVPNVASIDTGNIGNTRHRAKTIQRHWQHWEHKTQDKDNTETLARLGTQDTGQRQYRDTGKIGCLCSVSCVPNVSVLSLSCYLCSQCCQFLWIVHS